MFIHYGSILIVVGVSVTFMAVECKVRYALLVGDGVRKQIDDSCSPTVLYILVAPGLPHEVHDMIPKGGLRAKGRSASSVASRGCGTVVWKSEDGIPVLLPTLISACLIFSWLTERLNASVSTLQQLPYTWQNISFQ